VSPQSIYWILTARMIAAQSVAGRLGLYRQAIGNGQFPDLRSIVKDMTRRLESERARTRRDLPHQLMTRQRKRETRRWLLTTRRVPPGPCTYCAAPDARTVDHIVPVARGGDRWDLANLVRACVRCNSQKRNRTPEEWKAWRTARGLPWPPAWRPKAASLAAPAPPAGLPAGEHV
jgi:5-methylcytosine-specific restriction endonuclease McrA